MTERNCCLILNFALEHTYKVNYVKKEKIFVEGAKIWSNMKIPSCHCFYYFREVYGRIAPSYGKRSKCVRLVKLTFVLNLRFTWINVEKKHYFLTPITTNQSNSCVSTRSQSGNCALKHVLPAYHQIFQQKSFCYKIKWTKWFIIDDGIYQDKYVEVLDKTHQGSKHLEISCPVTFVRQNTIAKWHYMTKVIEFCLSQRLTWENNFSQK